MGRVTMAKVKLSSFHMTDLYVCSLVMPGVGGMYGMDMVDARGHRGRDVRGRRFLVVAIGVDIEDGLLAGYDSSGSHLVAFWIAMEGGVVDGGE